MFKLISFLKNHKKEGILGPIFKLIEAILELFIPIIMAKIIDIGINNKDISYVFKMGSLLILLGIVGLFFALICQYYASIASQSVGFDLRDKLFNHINTFSYSEIDKIGTPTLTTRIINDINQIQTGIAMLIRLGTRSPFILIGSIIMAFSIDFKLALILLISSPLIALVIYFVMNKSLPLFNKIQKTLDNISLISRENLDGIRVIKAFSKEDYEKEKFNASNNNLKDLYLKVSKISSLLNPITYIIMNLSIIAILYYGGIRVNIGSLTQGEVIAFTNYITQILLALIVFSNLIVILTKASNSATRVVEILNISSSIQDNKISTKDIESNSFIEFKDVSFKYTPDSDYSLKDINLNINKNEFIGIIGGTGSGKTTLINLLPRFYEATYGNIFLNGINIKNYNLKELRKSIGIVPQKAVLFNGTILDNLKLGNEHASNEDIERAINISQSTFVYNLKDKLNSKVLQNGKNFSGGQKQRLTIARALVSKPSVLILDDSSSALDFATDAALRKAIKDDSTDTTVIIVSQRTSSIKNCDKILVLDNGIISGFGTHDYLLENCNIYREINNSQLNN